MRKFLKKVLIALCLIVAIVGAGAYGMLMTICPQYSQRYSASILDKIELLKQIEDPKIVLVGHSNLAFGMDSAMLEDAMDMPVVNLGFHGSLGNEFHQNMAKKYISQGDIVVLCHSDYCDARSRIDDYGLTWNALENHFELWSFVPLDEWPNMIAEFPDYISRAAKLMKSGTGNQGDPSVYSRDAFNEYGDIKVERNENVYKWTEKSSPVFTIGEKTIKDVNRFNKLCKDKGATLVIAGYPIGDGEFTKDHSLYIEVWDELKEVVDCPVISEIEDYFYEYSYFYDTNLHLTTEGARMRTAQLIEDLTGMLSVE